jgi:hypothetical protein
VLKRSESRPANNFDNMEHSKMQGLGRLERSGSGTITRRNGLSVLKRSESRLKANSDYIRLAWPECNGGGAMTRHTGGGMKAGGRVKRLPTLLKKIEPCAWGLGTARRGPMWGGRGVQNPPVRIGLETTNNFDWLDAIMLLCASTKFKYFYQTFKQNKCSSRAVATNNETPRAVTLLRIGSQMNNTLNDALATKLERNTYAAKYTDYGAFEALNKAKLLVMAVSPSHKKTKRYAFTNQLADYYEVRAGVIKCQLERHRDEFVSDGLRLVTRTEAKALGLDASLFRNTCNIWTPRAALRLGMLLRESAVAKQVRSTLLDMVEIPPSPPLVKGGTGVGQQTLDLGDRQKCVNQIVDAITEFERKQTSPINMALRATVSRFGLADIEKMMVNGRIRTTADLEKAMGTMTEEAAKYFVSELQKTEWVEDYRPETLLEAMKGDRNEPAAELSAIDKRANALAEVREELSLLTELGQLTDADRVRLANRLRGDLL